HAVVPEEVERVAAGNALLPGKGAAHAAHDGFAAIGSGDRIRHGQLLVGGERIQEDDPEVGGVDVVVHALLQHLERPDHVGVVCEAEHGEGAVDDGRGAARGGGAAIAIEQHTARALARGDARKQRRKRRVEDVDVGKLVGERHARVDHPEEAAAFELIVVDGAIHALHGTIANGEDAVTDDVAALLRRDGLEVHGPELPDGLDAVVPARNAGGD